MKAYIFTEAGEGIGFGHLSRCISLYESLKEVGVKTEMIVSGTFQDISMLKGVNYRQQSWYNEEFLEQTVTDEDVCIIDSYLADISLYEILSNQAKRCVYIDDNSRLSYPKGIVVNPSLHIGNLSYPRKAGVTYLYGPSYVIVRPAFQKPGNQREVLRQVKDILVTMGGTDPMGMTLPLIDRLKASFPNIRLHVLITDAFSDKSKIEAKTTSRLHIYKNLDAEAMRGVMKKVDVAITAAGQTIYELMVSLTPFIPIQTVQNQENNVEGLRTYEIQTLYVKNESHVGYVEEALEEYLSPKIRNSLIQTYSHLIDGKGSKRIVEKLINGEKEV
ncbi:PseG/SpsG family protein [Salimicrobium halophilum]|uniref:Spore coat polysaccharide biosynthesis protein SpsG, predicted glycosyltransferase n=1 Tax=Salimicrobium halophilum TaxID=86666 RepID=A0A1G8V4T8_9BACI|nr:hypothetical protein [Salimicrobium halophilum]SDJ60375.1 Spore coat polysaccharide biosynthesis protein SpsG, predicted glycosyltransferase [Salimicrobium halophilum]